VIVKLVQLWRLSNYKWTSYEKMKLLYFMPEGRALKKKIFLKPGVDECQ